MVRRSRYLHYDEQENALMKSSNAFFRALSKDRVLFSVVNLCMITHTNAIEKRIYMC